MESRPSALGRAIVVALGLLSAMAGSPAVARQAREAPPVAASARTGTFANGMAYHIERTGGDNAKVSFNLVVKVGRLHGRPNDESAHVVEHIVVTRLGDVAAKGTLWERVARFGGAVNASAGDVSSNFYVTMPGKDPAAIATGLDILGDWAAAGGLSDSEIDREMKAVIEERRRGATSGEPPEATQSKIWFEGHPFLESDNRQPGSIAATPASIRALYNAYYQPSNMALVVVGDIDPDAVLLTLSRRLASLPRQPAPRPLAIPEARLGGGHYLPFINGEEKETLVDISFKLRPSADRSRAKDAAIDAILSKLSAVGFAGIADLDGSPILTGMISRSSRFAPKYGVDLITARVNVRGNAARAALSDALRLIETMRRQGVGASDFERVRAELLQEKIGDDAEAVAARWTEYYASGHMPPRASEIESELVGLTVADFNKGLARRLEPANRDIFIRYAKRDRDGVPAAAELPSLIAAAERGAPVSFALPAVREPAFLSPAASVQMAAPQNEAADVLRWTLPRSGATLLLRRTESPQVRLLLVRPGGMAGVDAGSADSARAASDIVDRGGLGGLSSAELHRYLQARGFEVRTAIRRNIEQIFASGPVERWPQLVGLARARMTEPECRDDALSDYVRSASDRLDPSSDSIVDDIFDQRVEAVTGGRQLPFAEDLARLRVGDICGAYRAAFGDTAGMTIVVEGNVGPEQVYSGVASLLDLAGPSRAADLPAAPAIAPGRTTIFVGARPAAKVRLAMRTHGDNRAGSLVADVLALRMFERLRSVEKGTYDVATGLNARDDLLTVEFDCAPENVERLIAAVKEEVERLGRDGPDEKEIATARRRVAADKISAEWIADNWMKRRSLAPMPLPGDEEIRAWARSELLPARFHEFVRLPAAMQS